jgi:hypothetical protein
MAQISVMTDHRERGERVVEILLPRLQASTALQAGEPGRLTSLQRGGLRVVLNVQPNKGATLVRVDRADTRPGDSERPAGVGHFPQGRGNSLADCHLDWPAETIGMGPRLRTLSSCLRALTKALCRRR